MGAWGIGIFSDDTASDIRDEWRDAVHDGLDADAATKRLLKSFSDLLDDPTDEEKYNEKLFWIALAAAQMETGRLVPYARDRAFEIIVSGGDVSRWLEDGDAASARQRERVLERLGAKLRGPQPKPKRLRRPVAYSVPFDVGDVVRVRDDRNGTAALVVVVANHKQEHPEELVPIVAALDWAGGDVPSRGTLARLPLVPDPISPERPLLILVTTTLKKDAFGPHLGELVGKGLSTRIEAGFDDVSHHMDWRVVPASVAETQLMASWRAAGED
jgi:hypothetical protein